jgi:hypothetical protein
MAVTVTGFSAQTTSAAVSGVAAGDLMIVTAHRDGSTTPPTLPSGFTTIDGPTGANTNSHRTGWKTCVGGETTSGTWTNATSVVCHIIHASAGEVLAIGAHALNGNASTSMGWSALTLTGTNGLSIVLLQGAHRSATNVGATALSPSGLTNDTSHTDCAGFASGSVSTWAAQTESVNANSGWRTETVEITVTVPIPPNAVQSASSTSGSVTLPNPVTAGNVLVLVSRQESNSRQLVSVADGASDAWVVAQAGNNPDFAHGLGAAYVLSAVGGSITVTPTYDAAPPSQTLLLAEYPGPATAVDINLWTDNAGVAATSLAIGPATPAQASELQVGYAWGQISGRVVSPPSTPAFGVDKQLQDTGSTAINLVLASFLQTALPGSESLTWKSDGGTTNQDWEIGWLSIETGGGGGAALAATCAATASLSAALTTAIPLAATPQAGASLTAALTTAIPLAAAPSAGATFAASLTTAIALAASASAGASCTAGLSTQIPLAAQVGGGATATGTLTTAITFSATATATATLGAALTTASGLAAALTSGATLGAALTTAIPLQVQVTGGATLVAALSTAIALGAQLPATVTLTAVLGSAVRAVYRASLALEGAYAPTLEAMAPADADLAAPAAYDATLELFCPDHADVDVDAAYDPTLELEVLS